MGGGDVNPEVLGSLASFPGSPECEMYMHGEPGSFSHMIHDVIKIGPEFLRTERQRFVVLTQPTMHSLGVYDIQPPITRYM